MQAILVTNDDGISSPGIKALARVLKQLGDVYTVAPEGEQSAVAHSLTLHKPIRSTHAAEKAYFINGTPTDCVILAVNKLLPVRPDIIVSGVNSGANLGDDITYSGTVAAAIEGTLLGIPSIAVSLVRENNSNGNRSSTSGFLTAARYARDIAARVLEKGLPGNTLLNVNVPHVRRIKGIRITKQGRRVYDNLVQERHDPRGREYYWIGGTVPVWESPEDSDFAAVREGYVSVTPVHLDLTNYQALRYLEETWGMTHKSQK
ncbi:MAG: 5'/3'-nucleotidase SurE [Nitrospiraceae bacterium]|nr:MAG: 5'/3'-nucleotidase SurE [Nitrospiraceae bacterium]